MVGRPSIMPDDFQDYFRKWLAGDMTQKEIGQELRVSQSVVSNWIGEYRDKTGLDKETSTAESRSNFPDVLNRYLQGEITQREAGSELGVSHTRFRQLAQKHTQGNEKQTAASSGLSGLAAKAAQAQAASNALAYQVKDTAGRQR